MGIWQQQLGKLESVKHPDLSKMYQGPRTDGTHFTFRVNWHTSLSISLLGGGPPPPPPPPGAPGAPPPPPPLGGMPRPPGMPSPQVNQDELLIKLGMKRKKKWSLGGQTKRTNWKSVS